MHDLTRSYRFHPPCRLPAESHRRRNSFPDPIRVQNSDLFHFRLQLKHGFHFVAAASESYADFFLAVMSGNVNSIPTVCAFLSIPRLALLPSFLIDIPALAKRSLSRFHIPHNSTRHNFAPASNRRFFCAWWNANLATIWLSRY